MAKESVKILRGKLDVDNLLSQLNAALAEEWLAYYQYWVGALVVEGAMRSDVQGRKASRPIIGRPDHRIGRSSGT